MAALPHSPRTSEICARLSICLSHRKTKKMLPRIFCVCFFVCVFPEKPASDLKNQSRHPYVTFYWSIVLQPSVCSSPSHDHRFSCAFPIMCGNHGLPSGVQFQLGEASSQHWYKKTNRNLTCHVIHPIKKPPKGRRMDIHHVPATQPSLQV